MSAFSRQARAVDSCSDLIEEIDTLVLPQLQGEVLERVIAELPLLNLHKAIQTGSLVMPDGRLARVHQCGDAVGAAAQIDATLFAEAVNRLRGQEILEQSLWRLENQHSDLSARLRITQRQIMFMAVTVLALLGLLMTIDWGYVVLGLSLMSGCFFTSLVALRVLCVLSKPESQRAVPILADSQLPLYTVLVPVFRETRVLPQLLSALQGLDYPTHLLDIKLILEESDVSMRVAVETQTLPSQFQVLIVPKGKPQTKPRALNYALSFARGTLLTIYDAEDIPEPRQLRLAAETFQACPDVACLQAKLAFFNAQENWLTRQFAAEYASLFNVLLPGLAAHGLPLPLGGTSNHFRINALRNAGAWDSFNVTEDADLGFRLCRQGYRTATLDSTTWEEANTQSWNWMQQRRRWLKGFLQTWLVHMRHPVQLWRDLRWDKFIALHAMSLGVILSCLFHPLLLGLTLWHFLSGQAAHQMNYTVQSWVVGVSLSVLIVGYVVAWMMASIGLRRQGIPVQLGTLASIPLYWIMMMPAAWLALADFIWRPHHWHKTEHGLSLFQNQHQAAPKE